MDNLFDQFICAHIKLRASFDTEPSATSKILNEEFNLFELGSKG
jgi:hypothetical protein